MTTAVERGGEDDWRLEIEVSRGFGERLNLSEDYCGEDDGDVDEEMEEEEEFSFMCGGAVETAITADDAFADGKIKPIYPLFDRDWDSEAFVENLPVMPSVKAVFVELREEESVNQTSPPPGNDEVVGPVCEWSGTKSAESSHQICKKSNSTGSSKIRRIKELVGRSNSDGRDAFVFLNKNHHPPPLSAASSAAEPKPVKIVRKSKQEGKIKTTPLSAHEVYLRSKAKQEEQRRSYLPYRPEFMGIFTNIHGGLSKNLHPF